MFHLEAFDQGAHHAMRHTLQPWSTPILSGLSWLGNPWTLLALTLLGAIWFTKNQQIRRGAILICLFAVGMGLTVLCREIVQRPRPKASWTPIDLPISYSFPSAHALNSIIVYLTIGIFLARDAKSSRAKTGIFFAISLIILLIGFSRLALGVHYPTDVICGWILGIALVLLGISFDSAPTPMGSIEKEHSHD